jgi:hypothetical protein
LALTPRQPQCACLAGRRASGRETARIGRLPALYLWQVSLLFVHFPLSYKYLKILGLNNKEKTPSPTTINKSAGCQWFILNMTPKLVNENENAPVINANFFICSDFIVP